MAVAAATTAGAGCSTASLNVLYEGDERILEKHAQCVHQIWSMDIRWLSGVGTVFG